MSSKVLEMGSGMEIIITREHSFKFALNYSMLHLSDMEYDNMRFALRIKISKCRKLIKLIIHIYRKLKIAFRFYLN